MEALCSSVKERRLGRGGRLASQRRVRIGVGERSTCGSPPSLEGQGPGVSHGQQPVQVRVSLRGRGLAPLGSPEVSAAGAAPLGASHSGHPALPGDPALSAEGHHLCADPSPEALFTFGAAGICWHPLVWPWPRRLLPPSCGSPALIRSFKRPEVGPGESGQVQVSWPRPLCDRRRARVGRFISAGLSCRRPSPEPGSEERGGEAQR